MSTVTVHGAFDARPQLVQDIFRNDLVRAFHEPTGEWLVHRVTEARFTVGPENEHVRTLLMRPLCALDGTPVARDLAATVLMPVTGTALEVLEPTSGPGDDLYGITLGDQDDIGDITRGDLVYLTDMSDAAHNHIAWRVRGARPTRFGDGPHYELRLDAVCDRHGLPLSLGTLHYGAPAGTAVRRATVNLRPGF